VTLANLVRTSNPKLPPLINPKTKFGTSRLLTFLEFSASPLKMITRLYADYGPVFTLSMFGQNITLLVGHEATEPFFKSPDSVLSQSEVYGFMKPVFGEGAYGLSSMNFHAIGNLPARVGWVVCVGFVISLVGC
jgi:hypothetical protein